MKLFAQQILQVYPYTQLISFGATPNSGFSVVVSKLPLAGSQKLLFKMQHVWLLIAPFHCSVTFSPPVSSSSSQLNQHPW